MDHQNRKIFFFVLILFLPVASMSHLVWGDDTGPGGPPFPNDAGDAQIDVSKYPEDVKADYKIFARRCSQCHSLSRPLNSQFLQLTADEQSSAHAKDPALFKDTKIWQVSES